MSLTAFSAGPGAMIAQIIRELGVLETIDNMVKWDPKQCKHSPGTHVLAMLINILMGLPPFPSQEAVQFNQNALTYCQLP